MFTRCSLLHIGREFVVKYELNYEVIPQFLWIFSWTYVKSPRFFSQVLSSTLVNLNLDFWRMKNEVFEGWDPTSCLILPINCRAWIGITLSRLFHLIPIRKLISLSSCVDVVKNGISCISVFCWNLNSSWT